MSFVVTPEPAALPPRVHLVLDTDDAGGSFTTLMVSRDGKLIRSQPLVGAPTASVYDYEAPFGVPAVYTATGTFLTTPTADWTETWASLAAWTGDTASYSVAAGAASSSVVNAQITRGASGTIERLSVTSPAYVRVELLTAAGVVVASVQNDSKVTVAGTTSTSVTGSGSWTATLTGGTISVAGTPWSATRTYSGVPTQVRVVSLGTSYPAGISWSTTGNPYSVWVDTAGNVFVSDEDNNLVRKYNSAGVQQTTWTTTGVPYHLWGDNATGNIFVTDFTNNLVRKYNSVGTQLASWTTTGSPYGIWGDATGNIFVTDFTNNLVRKYNSAGTLLTSWTTTGEPRGLWGDGAGNIFVIDYTNKLVRKYNSTGVLQTSWSTTGTGRDLWGDGAGNIFVTDYTNKLVRKYNSVGTQLASWSTTGASRGIWGDAAGNIFVGDNTNNVVRKYLAAVPTISTVAPTLVSTPSTFDATATTTLTVTEAWLIHPAQPSLSLSVEGGPASVVTNRINIEAATKETTTSAATRTVHELVGRARPIIVTTGARGADTWTMVLMAPTVAHKNSIRTLVDDQTPLLLRSPGSFGMDLPDDWYSVGDVTVDRPEVPLVDQQTFVSLPLTPVDSPIVRVGLTRTYGSVLVEATTYSALLTKYATYLDVLTGAPA